MAEFQGEPCLFVIFGGTGDLAKRKLLPALYHLATSERLRSPWAALAVGRNALDDEQYRDIAGAALKAAGIDAGAVSTWCNTCLYYRQASQDTQGYQRLASNIAALEQTLGLPSNRVFYLALPPDAFPDTIVGLGESGLNRSAGWARLVVEKPFGHDLASARELNTLIHRYFDESDVYRIDHYLGKETVQNLLAFRFANPIFESLWNRDRVESVRIIVAEDAGIGDRAGYYERAGAVRDMVQNHLTQLVSLVGMEVPGAFDPESVRNEKTKVVRAIEPIDADSVIFGQYVGGRIADREVPGYREEPGVSPNSQTETFVAIKLNVATWRWQGVPFYLVTGKRLPRRVSKILINFRCAPISLFQPYTCQLHSNVIEIIIQPDEGFDIGFEVKQPGDGMHLVRERLAFRYADTFSPLPDAYETLLLEVLQGDPSLFVRHDWVEASWQLYTPLLETARSVLPYKAGTWGQAAWRMLGEEAYRGE